MGDDDHHRIGRLHLFDGVEQHALAETVEARIRLVEHHEVRLAKERPGKTEALAKPARQMGPTAGDDRIVRLRQPDDRLMQTGQLRGFDDLLQIGVLQPRNDVPQCFADEIDILRQISKAPAAA